MLKDEEFTPHILCRDQASGERLTPALQTGAGEKALAVFNRAEYALQFALHRLPGESWQVAALQQREFLEWLRATVRATSWRRAPIRCSWDLFASMNLLTFRPSNCRR